ncbi:hypothetical protein CYMTET_22335 [Cymbomonas tetramitiformis]|uniref:Uncharacterized protein n=1 Tax=Cymbomonas tetramitiformis TaxID=36881 RepID=A0AAE0G0S2_9CHLO|nr:hypothetical protein CYMTET_22335 [Cymbomonas tetramitiformis]
MAPSRSVPQWGGQNANWPPPDDLGYPPQGYSPDRQGYPPPQAHAGPGPIWGGRLSMVDSMELATQTDQRCMAMRDGIMDRTADPITSKVGIPLYHATTIPNRRVAGASPWRPDRSASLHPGAHPPRTS